MTGACRPAPVEGARSVTGKSSTACTMAGSLRQGETTPAVTPLGLSHALA
jgi:hypothetical protein